MLADLAQREAAAKQERWEIVKVLAAFIAGVAVFGGLVLALSNYLNPANQQPMSPPGTVITIPPASTK